VKALVGGRAYSTSPFDRAIKARRQPGSAFKPFVYLAALEAGYSPDSIAYDAPITVAGWSPRNYTGKYRGEISLRDSLAHSVNTVAVRITAKVGPARVASTAARLGIHSPLHDQPSIALGTGEVSLLELTGAYAPFANGGRGALPHIIARVSDGDGKVLYARRRSTTGEVVAPGNVAAMNDMLSGVIRYGTGQKAALEGHEAAGKTGTTQSFRDAWFVGYTAQYVGGVWIGNDDGRKMKKVTGGSLPALVWHDVMTSAHAGKASLPLPGAQGRGYSETVADLQDTRNPGDAPFLARVFGFLSGR
jgi:penicillin-binding protein 1A